MFVLTIIWVGLNLRYNFRRFCFRYPLIISLEDHKGQPWGQYILLWTHLEIQNIFPYQVLPAHIMPCQSTTMKTPTFQKQNTDLSDQSDISNIRKVIYSSMILPRLSTKIKRKCWDKYNSIICPEIHCQRTFTNFD